MKRALALIAALATIASLIAPRSVSACGAFAGPRATDLATLPFLAVERVLIVWDEKTGIEDFVREARFDRANQTFGFVVPVPSKPEVAAVTKQPFDALEKAFVFEDFRAQMMRGGGGAGGGAPPVVVLAQQRIGSFTAFTLAATDANALQRWLDENGLAMNPDAKPWVERYVAMKFFFVAFRYEMGDPLADGMTSETVRIRFATPNPYYPYMEPGHAKPAAARATPRALRVWTVTRAPMIPLAASRAPDAAGRRRWQIPWEVGNLYHPTSEDLAKAVGPDLAPLLPKEKSLVVSRFRDVKAVRDNFGDVVMVPSVPSLTVDASEAKKTLAAALDPTLVDETWASWQSIDDTWYPPPPPTKPDPLAKPEGRSRCTTSAADAVTTEGHAGWIAVAVAATIATCMRRRRTHAWGLSILVATSVLVTTLGACKRPPPAPAVDASSPMSSAVPIAVTLPPREARERSALALLAGQDPEGSIRPYPAWMPLDDVKDPPKPRVRWNMGRISQGGGWNIGPFTGRLERCYEAALVTAPKMRGKATFELTSKNVEGPVVVRVTESEGVSPFVTSCCANVFAASNFDVGKIEGDTGVSVPIMLSFGLDGP